MCYLCVKRLWINCLMVLVVCLNGVNVLLRFLKISKNLFRSAFCNHFVTSSNQIVTIL